MTKSQFIKNTMPTIQRVAADAAPGAFESVPKRQSVNDTGSLLPKSPTLPQMKHRNRGSVDLDASNAFKASETTIRSDSVTTTNSPSQNLDSSSNDVGPLVATPFRGTMKAWEAQVETVLKEFYGSIQKQKLPLHGVTEGNGDQPQQTNYLLSLTGNVLRRSPSTISKSSDVYPRGRATGDRATTARWSSKPRSRARLYPTASHLGSSRTSLDDQSSVWSPAASSTWSRYSLNKTLTSMSVDSLGSEYPRGDYQQSVGFANALSHAIIREDPTTSNSNFEDPARAASLLEDETLELAGAPWAKEGIVKHKHQPR